MKIFKCNHWQGELKALEGQELKWVKLEELKDYPMPEANNLFKP